MSNNVKYQNILHIFAQIPLELFCISLYINLKYTIVYCFQVYCYIIASQYSVGFLTNFSPIYLVYMYIRSLKVHYTIDTFFKVTIKYWTLNLCVVSGSVRAFFSSPTPCWAGAATSVGVRQAYAMVRLHTRLSRCTCM